MDHTPATAEQLGEAAYNAYCASRGEAGPAPDLSVDMRQSDVTLPPWSHLRNEVRTAWQRAAAAVQSVVAKDVIAGLPVSARTKDIYAGMTPGTGGWM